MTVVVLAGCGDISKPETSEEQDKHVVENNIIEESGEDVFDSEESLENTWTASMGDKDLGIHSLSISENINIWNYYSEDESGSEITKDGTWEFKLNALTLIDENGDLFAEYYIDDVSGSRLELENLETGDVIIWDVFGGNFN